MIKNTKESEAEFKESPIQIYQEIIGGFNFGHISKSEAFFETNKIY